MRITKAEMLKLSERLDADLRDGVKLMYLQHPCDLRLCATEFIRLARLAQRSLALRAKARRGA